MNLKTQMLILKSRPKKRKPRLGEPRAKEGGQKHRYPLEGKKGT